MSLYARLQQQLGPISSSSANSTKVQQLQAKGASVLAACWAKVINETTALLSGRRAAYLAQNASAVVGASEPGRRAGDLAGAPVWDQADAGRVVTGERKRLAQRLHPARGGDRGTPLRERGGLVVGAVLALTVVVGVVAFLIGRGVSTPGQQAARAKAPAASLLTAPVVLTHARTTVVLRGTLTDGGAISVGVPGDLSGDLAVVTAVGTAPGARVGDGSLIAAVAGRPVFVMRGQIPAYSTMSYGSAGSTSASCRRGLRRAGSRSG